MEKEEAEKYAKLRQELHSTELQLRLFQLYYNEKSSEDVKDELEKRQKELKQYEAKRDAVDAEIREKKKVQNSEARAVAKIEEAIKELEIKIAKRKPQAIKAKEQIAHVEKKVEAAKQSYEAAAKANVAHVKEIKSIEEEIKKMEKEREEFEKSVESESLSQGINLELRASQVDIESDSYNISIIVLIFMSVLDEGLSKAERRGGQTKCQVPRGSRYVATRAKDRSGQSRQRDAQTE